MLWTAFSSSQLVTARKAARQDPDFDLADRADTEKVADAADFDAMARWRGRPSAARYRYYTVVYSSSALFTVTHLACISFLYMAYTLGGRDCARFSADKSFGVLRECDSPQEV